MYHPVVLMAFTGLFAHAALDEPTWLKNYPAALQQADSQGKPLAVVVGSGNAGWQKLSDQGKLSPQALRTLAKDYICLYVDTEHIGGRKLADALEMTEPVGVVLSDRGGRLQAFRHDGQLSDEELARYLQRYADPERVVRQTDDINSDYRRNYPVDPPAPVYRQPMYVPMMGGCST